MTRAEYLKDVVVEGLREIKLDKQTTIVEGVAFEYDPFRDRVIAYCPRPRLNLRDPAPDEMVGYLRESIEAGLRVNGFYDAIWIEP